MNRKLALLTIVVLAVARPGAIFAADAFDWAPWQALPVQNGGRHKPLDSLAWESLRAIANRGHQIDPQSQQQLRPIAWYMTMLFDWRGWDHPTSRRWN